MKYTFILLMLFAGLQTLSFAQADTTYMYLNYDGVTTKDSANTYIKFYKDGDVWYGKQYYMNTGVLKSEGHYQEVNYLKTIRTFKNYNRKGVLTSMSILDDKGTLLEKTYYYPSGNRQSYQNFPKGARSVKTCWDSLGTVINDCEIASEAHFKGGMEGWRRFLERNLNAMVPWKAGAPVGVYTVTAQFVVGKDGLLRHIKAVDVPKRCKPCAVEVVNLLSRSPKWEPAMEDGEPVEYQAFQKVSFQVAKE